ncbi:hypothetical protein INR49_031108 [Caranx melampygus]|nr:hypothetical protein INR49_031108 [Caranx melampygus]
MDNSSLEEMESEGSKNCTVPDSCANSSSSKPYVMLLAGGRQSESQTIYMFCALALVCDDYFVPSLEKICERLQLSEDVAGATFMAAGSSAPELFTSIIGVFITKGDVGVGTIVGSAVFNILCIIGVCGFFAGQAVKLSYWALLRDSIYYTFSVTALIVFIYDEKVCWWESLVLIVMYAGYILIMKFNGRAHRYFDRRNKSSVNLANGLTGSTDLEDNVTCDATAVLLKKANFHCKPSVLMVDELLSAYPHQLSFSEAGMRIMITSHFSPRTRLTMASRMLINERQRLINTTETRVNRITNGDSDSAARSQGRRGLENGMGGAEQSVNGRCRLQRLESGNETENENEDNENNENDEEREGEDDNGGPLVPFKIPAALGEMVYGVLLHRHHLDCWPVLHHGLDGTSVPDCMASVIVARQGMGDMAISNSIGSNVFDILVGLGLPWALQTLCIDYGSIVNPAEQQRPHILCGTFTSLSILHSSRCPFKQMDSGSAAGAGLPHLVRHLPVLLHLIEFNVFIFVNLPMCRDIH